MLSADLDEEELDKRSAAIEIIAELQLTAEQLKVRVTVTMAIITISGNSCSQQDSHPMYHSCCLEEE